MDSSSESETCPRATGHIATPPATSTPAKTTTSRPTTRSIPRRRRGPRRSIRRWRRKWAPRRTADAAPRNTIQTKQSRATSSYHWKVACMTYRLHTPRKTSATRTSISPRQTQSTSTLLRGGPRLRDHPIHQLLARLLLEELPDRLGALLEEAQVLHLVDLHALGLHGREALHLRLQLVLTVLGARGGHGVVDHLLEIGGQALVFRLGHEPRGGGIRVLRLRVVLGDLVELVGDRGRHRQLEPVHRALAHRHVHLAPDHRHRVGPELLEHLDQGGDRGNADGLALEIVGHEHRPLVGENAAEAEAAAVAEALGPERLEVLDELLAHRAVHHAPHVLAVLVEERHVGGEELGIELAARGRQRDRGDVHGAELHALDGHDLVLGELPGRIDLYLDAAAALGLGDLL